MARSYWAVEKWNGATFVADGSIYKSNSSMDISITGTMSKVKLADGSNAFFSPEVLYVNEPIIFQWMEIYPSDAFVTKIVNYVKNQDYLRLTDSLGTTYTGKFVSFRRIWLTGVDDTWDLESNFEVMV